MSTTPPPPEPYEPATRRDDHAAPAVSGAPAAPAYAPYAESRPTPSKKLGVIAFIASLIAVVVGSILAFVAGLQSAGVAQYADRETNQIDPNTLPPGVEQSAILVATLSVLAFVVYGVFALWGLIQGIIAAVKNRGRGWAIAAIILAVLGGIVVVVALGVGAAAGVGSVM